MDGYNFANYAVDPDAEKIFEKGTPENLSVLRTNPPETSAGIEDATDLLSSVHHPESESSFFSLNLNSDKTVFEMWYDNEEIDFYYIFDETEEDEEHHRRQLSGYYEGIDIEKLTLPENKFINVNAGEDIAIANLGMTHHFYEPIAMADDDGGDPYKPILNEIDSKSNTKVMLQVLYKSYPEKWQNMYGDSLRKYGQRVDQSGELDSRLFGLVSRSIDDNSVKEQAAQGIRSQIGHPAYYVEARIIVISKSEKNANTELSSIIDLIEKNYSGKTEQKLTSVDLGCSASELLGNMLTREFFSPQGPPTGLLGELKGRIMGTNPYMILTAPELASLSHLPSHDSVSISGINYTPALVEGTLPPEAQEFDMEEYERQIEN